jgi:hypothetical protein
MTKKDFVAIAAIVKKTRDDRSRRETVDMRMGAGIATSVLAVRLADHFAKDNDRFDTGRFLKACGVGQ